MENFRYLLECPGDSRDMGPVIERALSEHGACLLGTGIFCVSGVKMPRGTTLAGLGDATVLVLKSEVTAGAAVTMNTYCTVKDLTFCGDAAKLEADKKLPGYGICEDTARIPSALGERHGILFAGTATGQEWKKQPHNSVIENCRILDFSGGGIACRDTGYSINASLTVTNCHILYCGAGIFIPHYSEFNKFTNVLCSDNFYGCVNNGGNNMFVNCGFNANKTGFILDNRDGKAMNNSHGSAVGCTFHHSDGNNGVGIALFGAKWGFVFSGGQLGFSKIVVENSSAILFSAMNFLHRVDISVKGGKPVLFCGNVFHEPPAVSASDGGAVRYSGCYLMDGTPLDNL